MYTALKWFGRNILRKRLTSVKGTGKYGLIVQLLKEG